MAEARRKFDREFRQGAVRIVRETGSRSRRWPGSWVSMRARWRTGVARDRRARGGDGRLGEDERAELARLRRENAELAMERDVLIGLVEERVRARRSGCLVMSQALGGPLGQGCDGPVAVAVFIAAQRELHRVSHSSSPVPPPGRGSASAHHITGAARRAARGAEADAAVLCATPRPRCSPPPRRNAGTPA
jgi:transposase